VWYGVRKARASVPRRCSSWIDDRRISTWGVAVEVGAKSAISFAIRVVNGSG
jgi:hypothetical protein